ncbi:trypsin-like peptidase domain-containing protein [Xenorhabdus sp. DI]|uniref:S1 family peptidase n=1 Tax=Xenorhabdus doucetiae TaxID=351671 RepID=UPI0019B97457|nr:MULTISPECIES: serine protease [unclassified Xenorhabdus]MBD2786544.1 trypsin-like peptidase domain-containing protein [Xenorhabdus sp. 3]MBD2790370.1 trypsin-like peptidase domain-containing protein [Xenorhabdus sp. DI]
MLVSSYDFYPYYPVTEHVTSWIEQNGTTQLFEKWQKSFVSFFAKDEFSMKSASLIGSGFLYLLDGKHPCIVTAAHVVHELLKSALPFFSINGDNYIFHKLNVNYNDEQDYAIIHFSEEMLALQKSWLFFSSDERPLMNKTSSFVIMGYPASKNDLHIDRNHKGLFPCNITFHSFKYNKENEDVYFWLDEKAKNKNILFEERSNLKSLPLPSWRGMSGSVIAQIMEHKITGDFTLRAVGIFKEHKNKQRDKYLVGCTFVPFADEVNTYIRKYT